MPQLPIAWRDALVAREAESRPDRDVVLHLRRTKRFDDKLSERDVDPGDLDRELNAILAFQRRPPTKQYPNGSYAIRTPRLALVVKSIEEGETTLAQFVDAWKPKPGLPSLAVPHLRAELYHAPTVKAFDLDRAHQDYQAAVEAATKAARAAARLGEPSHDPAQQLRYELDRQLLPARTILDLVAKRDKVVTEASADGVVVGDGTAAVDVLRVRLGAVSGAFVEDADVILTWEGPPGELKAEVVEAIGDEVILRPKAAADTARLPPPGSQVRLARPAPPSNRAVARAITSAQRGTVVGDWDGLTRLLVSPQSLPSVQAPDDIRVDPKLSTEQADAVRRAISTSQAFFIQGPPGTGKTTVITEIVRRLAERGERVLLAAPMHVAVDVVLSKLSNDPLVWPMRVAAKEENIDAEVRHLRENTIKSSAVVQVKDRLVRRNQEWPAEIAGLGDRLRALERLEIAEAEHARLALALLGITRSGEREALTADIAQDDRESARITGEVSAAESAAAAAEFTIAQVSPLIEPALADATAAAAWLAGLRVALREVEEEVAAANRKSAAAQRGMTRTSHDLDGLGVRLATLEDRIAVLRDRYASAWREDIVTYRGYLQDRVQRMNRRRKDHERTAAQALDVADARIRNIRGRIAELRQENQRARSSMSRFSEAAVQDGRRAAQAAAAARAADADYQQARTRAKLRSRMADGLGLGELAARRGAAASQVQAYEAAEHDQGNHLEAAARAKRQADSATVRLMTADSELKEALNAHRLTVDSHAAQAATLAGTEQALTLLRARFAEDRTFCRTLADLYQLSREGMPATGLDKVMLESGRVARAMWTGRRAAAAELLVLRTDREQAREALARAQEKHAWYTADLRRYAGLVSDTREVLGEAREAEDAQAAVAAGLDAASEALRNGRDLALADHAQALETQSRLQADLAALARHRDVLSGRLSDADARLSLASNRTAEAAELLEQARAVAREACDGQLPADRAAGMAQARTRIGRLETLIGLESRWRELVSQADAGEVDATEELGDAVVDATNLVCATVTGIAGSPSAKRADFDTLILDEASRVIDADLLVPAVRARRWILVGDERQLPPYVDQETEQHIHALLALRAAEQDQVSLDVAVAQIAGIHDNLLPSRPIRKEPTVDLAARMETDGTWAAHYREHLDLTLQELGGNLALLPGDEEQRDPGRSLIIALATNQSVSRFEKCVTHPDTAGMRAQLTTQRRMIGPIAELVKVPVYRGAYHTPDEAQLRRTGIRPFTGADYDYPVTFYNSGRSAKSAELRGTGFVNEFEADLIVNLLHIWDKIAGHGGQPARPSFSVLAFYKAQAALIERRLDRKPLRKLKRDKIDSIDKIQGQESDLIVISFVRTFRDKTGQPRKPGKGAAMWLQDIHRLNVAVTRPRLALALVGERQTLQYLRGNEEAEAFYANMFRLLDERADGMRFVRDPSL